MVDVIRVTKPYKLTSREMKPDDTVVVVGGIRIGEQRPVVIAGPCSVETRDQTIETAKRVKALGAHLLRGGAFKPRTSPYAFQGLGEKGLEILDKSTAVFPNNSQMLDRDSLNQIRDVMNEFFANPAITPEAAQASFVEIIKNAPPL